MRQCDICRIRFNQVEMPGWTCIECREIIRVTEEIHSKSRSNQCEGDRESKQVLIEKYEKLVRNKQPIFEDTI